jgi:predicted type IV restriction endonuclease
MLKDDLEDIRAGIKTGRFTSEAAVRQGIVLRLLQSLSWPTYNTQIVAPEYTVEGRRVDFALCHPAGKPAVFIEVKQIGQGNGGERQLFEYAFHKGVPMAILTDGQEWHFFLPGEQGDYGERRVYKLDVVERELDEAVKRLQRYLDYNAISSGNAMKSARADYENVARERQIQFNLPEAWRKIVADEDELLLELIADRVESLCGYKPDPDTVAAFVKEGLTIKETNSATAVPKQQPKKITTPPTPTVFPLPHPNQLAKIGFVLNGKFHPARNARDVIVKVFTELANRDGGFLERFASLPKHGRSRRYLARKPSDLYPERPDLARDFSYEFKPGWWLGINLSRAAVKRIIEMGCEVAGLQYGLDLKIYLGE